MKLLITVINKEEAKKVIRPKYNVDILDIKNPQEGSLGAPPPHLVKEILEVVPSRSKLEISIAVGDVPNLPCSVALAVLGAMRFKPHYIKIGLKGVRKEKETEALVKTVMETVEKFKYRGKIVLAAFADYLRVGSLNPYHLPRIAKFYGVKMCMIDTAVKDGKNLLDFLTLRDLKRFVQKCHKGNIRVALAGSLKEEHIPLILTTGADIIGLRGAVCKNKDRESSIRTSYLLKFTNLIRK